MENKTTTELLEILWKIEKADSDDKWDEYEAAYTELCSRTPFKDILGMRTEANEFTLEERIDELEDQLKLLKRHKHDPNNGDVLIRI